jgi:hypothetical protein
MNTSQRFWAEAIRNGLPVSSEGCPTLPELSSQCDRIGRIFAHWAIGYFVQFSGNCKSSPYIFWGYSFPQLRFDIKFGKNGLGYILGEFFTNSSGHPAPAACPMSGLILSNPLSPLFPFQNVIQTFFHSNSSQSYESENKVQFSDH